MDGAEVTSETAIEIATLLLTGTQLGLSIKNGISFNGKMYADDVLDMSGVKVVDDVNIASGTSIGVNNSTTSVRADFYVTPTGDVVPSTGYRYMPRDASYIPTLKNTLEIPANPNGTYISFDKFDVPEPGKLQVPHDASIRGTFDTLQIIDDIRIPNGKWGNASWLEPITKDFNKFGPGGATQAITKNKIILESLDDLLQ